MFGKKKGVHDAPENSYQDGFLYHDVVELTDAYLSVQDEVEEEVERRLADVPKGMGYCHAYWACKQQVLAERGIEWRSPSQLNPGVMFD